LTYIIFFYGVGVIVGVTVLVGVMLGVKVGVKVFVGVIVGVTLCVGVIVGVTDGVTVFVGVTDGVTVFVGVTDGVGPLIVNVKSSTGQNSSPQSGQSGLNILNVSFNRLKLCFTSGADNGETYILN
jgi:hypothetical protein